MNKSSNTLERLRLTCAARPLPDDGEVQNRRLPDLGLEPLSARSLVLSTLLGSHPPRLPAQALVVLGAQFAIAEGAMRTALSRMVADGDLVASDGRYELPAFLVERQASQDAGLRIPEEPWDGSWWVATVTTARRTMAERRAFRAQMLAGRMGELRPDTWLRPANIPRPAAAHGALLVHGLIEGAEPEDVVAGLWDLGELASAGRNLLSLADDAGGWLETADPAVLSDSLLVCIALVRFLRLEPQLPVSVVGHRWPPNRLRRAYPLLQERYADLVRSFLTTVAANAT